MPNQLAPLGPRLKFVEKMAELQRWRPRETARVQGSSAAD